ncbi:hypothetical protein EXT48_21585 [Pseudoalteromonas sp. CO348]|nr:hypothetical protein EXT48_21585 [Pseudoalteromonas sp. CO348]
MTVGRDFVVVEWRYIDSQASPIPKVIKFNYKNYQMRYYARESCQWTELLSIPSMVYDSCSRNWIKGDESQTIYVASIRYSGGACSSASGQNKVAYPVVSVAHPICGSGLCTIRED